METLEKKPAKGSVKKNIRKGRGNASGKGGEAGRGHKGQKSRSGYKSRPGFEGGQMPLYRRLPKKRGLGNPVRTIYTIVNLETLEHYFSDGDIVDTTSLHEKGIIKKNEEVKILSKGNLTKKLTVKAGRFSKEAIKKIEAAGASHEIIQ